jgi:hypothetical protein
MFLDERVLCGDRMHVDEGQLNEEVEIGLNVENSGTIARPIELTIVTPTFKERANVPILLGS